MQRDVNLRESLIELDRINIKCLQIREIVQRDVIIKFTARFAGEVTRNRRRMLAASQEIDFDQVDLARQDLFCIRRWRSRPCSPGVLFE